MGALLPQCHPYALDTQNERSTIRSAHACSRSELAAGAAGPAHGQAHRMPMADSCSFRSGDSVAALLR
jgi:uncharacterized protein YgbK (DUF1537 family)